VLPEYGSDRIVTVAPDDFSADSPRRHRSKNVTLATRALV